MPDNFNSVSKLSVAQYSIIDTFSQTSYQNINSISKSVVPLYDETDLYSTPLLNVTGICWFSDYEGTNNLDVRRYGSGPVIEIDPGFSVINNMMVQIKPNPNTDDGLYRLTFYDNNNYIFYPTDFSTTPSESVRSAYICLYNPDEYDSMLGVGYTRLGFVTRAFFDYYFIQQRTLNIDNLCILGFVSYVRSTGNTYTTFQVSDYDTNEGRSQYGRFYLAEYAFDVIDGGELRY